MRIPDSTYLTDNLLNVNEHAFRMISKTYSYGRKRAAEEDASSSAEKHKKITVKVPATGPGESWDRKDENPTEAKAAPNNTAQISRKPKSNVPKPRKIIVIRSPKKEWKDITERDFYPRGKLYLNNLAASSNLFGKLLTTDEDGKLVNFDDKIIFDHKGQYTPENTPKTLSVCWESLLQSDLAKKRRRYSSMTNIPEDERWTALGVWLDWLCKKELNLGPDNDILKTTLRTLAHFIGDKTGFVSALSDYKSVASP